MVSIEAINISKFYGRQKALDNVQLQISKGEIVGMLGPNGAGKSTLMRVLTSFLPPSSGTALINGIDVRENPIEVRRLIGYLPENNPLYPDMYVKEYLAFVFKMYKQTTNATAAVNRVIDLTGLRPEYTKKIGALSKGYRQRVGLAQALVHDPEILILDEPTSGLDPNQLLDIRKIITDLGKEKTVMLSTHIMQEVEAVCNRVIIIDQGRIVADEPTADLSKIIGKSLRFRVEFKEQLTRSLLARLPFVNKVEQIQEKGWLLEAKDNKDIREDIFQFAVTNNYNVLSLSREEQKMETVFRRLTKRQN
ncbi:MAG: gliding motility-associated ABC transporter ATP-binding subunit GldA [Bacteroidales bacterium]|nr:gliding motility-associated ABC transporter ATP-binding subunit GldA [Bacteroidales bacterium]